MNARVNNLMGADEGILKKKELTNIHLAEQNYHRLYIATLHFKKTAFAQCGSNPSSIRVEPIASEDKDSTSSNE